jgi:bifunctional DNA-binding transcriptional regulator/antitoxin component of YhaV-PrlF toxin-antitoxin module
MIPRCKGILDDTISPNVMKLQKVKAYKLDHERWQYKYQLTVPETSIEKLGWKEGDELQDIVHEGSLVITPSIGGAKKVRRIITTKMSYEEFREKVRQTLQYSDKGMTWTQIRSQLKLDQVVPNNKWVRQMEKDIGLVRVKGSNGVIVWRVNHVR